MMLKSQLKKMDPSTIPPVQICSPTPKAVLYIRVCVCVCVCVCVRVCVCVTLVIIIIVIYLYLFIWYPLSTQYPNKKRIHVNGH